jgi:hypothetical protein
MKIQKIEDMDEKAIEEFINDNLTVKKEEKDKYGEVFTPSVLIIKMLDHLPKRVWFDPKLKWLDPSAGVGNFMLIIYLKLMNGLTNSFPNKKERSTHIIKNMLYMVEINKKNCRKMRNIFGKNSNIFCADFLADGWQSRVCDDKCFGIVIGNPPFQDDYGHNSGNRVLGGKNKLYERIFLKSYMLLKDGGYLTFITPDNIFSGNTMGSYKVLIDNHVSYINFNTELQSHFPTIQQDICYFVLQKTKPNNKTTIENTYGEKFTTTLEDRPINPVKNWTNHTEKLLKTFVSNDKNNALYNRGKPIKEYNGDKYKIIYTPNQLLYTNDEKNALGLGIKKIVIFSISPKLEFKMDYEGNYGIGPNTFYIPFQTKKEGKILERFFASSDYKTLANATKTTRYFLKNAFIQHLNLDFILQNKKNKKNKNTCKRNCKNKPKQNKTKKQKFIY